MTQFEIWKLLADIGLLCSLIFFAYRFVKGQGQAPVNTFELEELQSGLRSAIREADQAGRTLNEQFFQRKQSLEKLLYDLETVESRINKAVTNAEVKKGDLQLEIKKAETLSLQSIREVQDLPNKESLQQDDFTPPTFEEIGYQEIRSKDSSEGSSAARVNIYGEPIDDVPSFRSTPLTAKIEKDIEAKEIEKVEVIKVKDKKSIEEIYAEAEELLRAGKAVEEVSKSTKLSADEVRLLSRMLEEDTPEETVDIDNSENDVDNTTNSDERLGVLAGLKRQVQVL